MLEDASDGMRASTARRRRVATACRLAVAPLAGLAVTALLLGACSGSDLEALEGRWSGEIVCAGFTSRLAMSLRVSGSKISGDGQTRTKEITADWKVEGGGETKQRSALCPDDSCLTDADCADRGGGTCNSLGLCRPCTIRESYREITLTFVDVDVQSPDPQFTLERQGEALLTGTVKGFCPDELLATPEVKIEKDP